MSEKKLSRRELLEKTGKAALGLGLGSVVATLSTACGGGDDHSSDSGFVDGEDAGYSFASRGTLSGRRYSPVEV